ncbi:MAG: Zn-dependent hydrolase [Oscillospiraceae bacterium]|nr:Zn-dependent hydrolase [Oscillospiraceae bacterium]
MKKTFTTVMPDQVGAFLAASEIFAALQLNITRVSYNKAVDTHMLFIEAEGDAAALEQAAASLEAIGYLQDGKNSGRVILLEFRLRDRPGAVRPVLELISRFRFNISYISSQENGTGHQHFRMGLFVEGGEDISRFLRQVTQLCDVRILHYDPSGIALDNTVFYLSFADRIAEKLGLSDEEKRRLIVDSNLVMELLTQRNSPPYKTFDYIGKFAECLHAAHGAAYVPRITRYPLPDGGTAVLVEPPCGSNLCLMETGGELLCVDSGFPCFQAETLACLRGLYPNFDTRRKTLLLTHADVDHCGLVDYFDRVLVSRESLQNFVRENAGQDNFREQNPLHAPYVRISKLLSGYRPFSTARMEEIGGRSDDDDSLLTRIGCVDIGGLRFEVYEAAGGHVRGETVYVERRLRIVFTGDIFVNPKGFLPAQAAFNRLAPYLMTSVDTDPELAAQERTAVFALLKEGHWLLFGGHGAAMPVEC